MTHGSPVATGEGGDYTTFPLEPPMNLKDKFKPIRCLLEGHGLIMYHIQDFSAHANLTFY